jgi:hypothetical protein
MRSGRSYAKRRVLPARSTYDQDVNDALELGRVTAERPPFQYSALARVWFSDTDAQSRPLRAPPTSIMLAPSTRTRTSSRGREFVMRALEANAPRADDLSSQAVGESALERHLRRRTVRPRTTCHGDRDPDARSRDLDCDDRRGPGRILPSRIRAISKREARCWKRWNGCRSAEEPDDALRRIAVLADEPGVSGRNRPDRGARPSRRCPTTRATKVPIEFRARRRWLWSTEPQMRAARAGGRVPRPTCSSAGIRAADAGPRLATREAAVGGVDRAGARPGGRARGSHPLSPYLLVMTHKGDAIPRSRYPSRFHGASLDRGTERPRGQASSLAPHGGTYARGPSKSGGPRGEMPPGHSPGRKPRPGPRCSPETSAST